MALVMFRRNGVAEVDRREVQNRVVAAVESDPSVLFAPIQLAFGRLAFFR